MKTWFGARSLARCGDYSGGFLSCSAVCLYLFSCESMQDLQCGQISSAYLTSTFVALLRQLSIFFIQRQNRLESIKVVEDAIIEDPQEDILLKGQLKGSQFLLSLYVPRISAMWSVKVVLAPNIFAFGLDVLLCTVQWCVYPVSS